MTCLRHTIHPFDARRVGLSRISAWRRVTGRERWRYGRTPPQRHHQNTRDQRQLNSQTSTLKLHHHRLLLGVVLIPMSAALPSNPRLLIATKRQRRIKGHVLIDPHNAGLQSPGNRVCTG